MSDIQLWCYIERDNSHFLIVVSPTLVIDDLRTKIKEKKSNLLQKVDASNLVLWKVRYF